MRSLTLAAALPATTAGFGADWLYVMVPVAVFVAVLAGFAAMGRASAPTTRPLQRMAHGAARASGLPAWCAGTLVVAIGGLGFAVLGFIWDVAWHIGIGRDEVLFSPPHVHLLLGLGLLGLAGVLGSSVATRDRVQVGWRVDRWRVPMGAAVLMAAGATAMAGFGIDELWHAAYGLDVTMWSPPHLAMISAAAFTPLALWLLLAEAGPRAGHRVVRRHLGPFLAGAALIGLSAWQLEFDLGVPQWPAVYHPLLVAIAAGFALSAARAAFGRGGALLTVLHFVIVRGVLAVVTTQLWGLNQPRFVPYLAAAIAVEVAFAVVERRAPHRVGLLSGVAVATVGLAGAWVATGVWGWHPWSAALGAWWLLPPIAAVAAAVLGTGFGRVVGQRASGLRPRRWEAASSCSSSSSQRRCPGRCRRWTRRSARAPPVHRTSRLTRTAARRSMWRSRSIPWLRRPRRSASR
jgi:hypothetical protein